MKSFTYPQKLVVRLATFVARIPTKSTIPLLACVRLGFTVDGLRMEVTNLENWMTVATPGFDEKNAVWAIIPFKQFFSIIGGMDKAADISFKVTEARLTLKTETSTYNFGITHEEWPATPTSHTPAVIRMKSEDFADILRFIQPSMSSEETRYYLCGMHVINSTEGKIRFQATDGHRVTIKSVPVVPTPQLSAGGHIVPRATIAIYQDLLQRIDVGTELAFSLTEARVALDFECDVQISLTGRLIEGSFPDIDRVVPYQRDHAVNIIKRKDCLNILRRLNAFMAQEKYSHVTLEFSVAGVTFSAKATHDDATETLPPAKEGVNGRMSFQIPLLMEILEGFEVDELTVLHSHMRIKGNDASVIFVADQTLLRPDSPALAILMQVVK